MKKIIILLVTLLFAVIAISAQEAQTTPQEKIGKAVKKAYKSTRKQMNRATHQVGEAIGLEAAANGYEPDDIKIKGYYYMPLYDTNLYHQPEGEEFRRVCTEQFKAKYPNVEVMSVVIPQTDWVEEEVTQNSKVVGYGQYMYVFIIARDGSEGYINSRFAFRKYKDVGESFHQLSGSWPKWERTDVLPVKVYNKLLKM